MRRVSALLPLAWLTVTACAAEPPPPAPMPVAPPPVSTVVVPSAPPPAPREDGKLPSLATALRYELSLTIDPNLPRFGGQVRILVNVPAATSYVVLNARDLNVSKATAQVGQALVPATTSSRAANGSKLADELVLTFDRPIPAGQAVLALSFDAPFGDSLAGLYRVNEGGKWYAFTQFEATDARRAFPCFDEPGQKVPFDVRITTPQGLLAFSNMPETKRTDAAGAAGAGGTTTYEFATTPPLPTYLVAYAVGDFDVREGQRGPVPIRLITTKGKSGLGTIALADTAALVKEGGSYFGIAYPYPKLDIVAVPNFAAGAMENAGLITFREELLLLDPEHAPQRARMSEAEVIAHELSHQWFGDLVTTAWWDDIWLNEGFATWAQTKMVEPLFPKYRAALEATEALGDVMETDSLKSARAVRQPVHSIGEAMESFDGLTYRKGAAVLRMVEHAIGSDVFRAGVEQYLRDHAWKNATADDLFAALSKASGKDVGKMAAGFLDRPGVPNVAVSVDCKGKAPSLTLTQAPWHLFGDASAPSGATTPWTIPTDLFAANEELRILLPSATGTYPVPKCPAFVDPNVGAFGYYHYSLDEQGWRTLASAIGKQPDASRVAFVQNLWAQVQSGGLSPDVFLKVLPSLDGETNRVVIESEIDALYEFRHELVTPAAAPAFATFVTARLAPHLKRLPKEGGKVKPTEDDRLLRRALFRALGQLANDPATLAEADKVTLAWLKDPNAVDGDLARVAVILGSRKAGRERIDALRAAIKSARTPNDKKTAIMGLSGFEDPALIDQALSVALTDEIATQDVAILLLGAAYHPYSHAAVTDWVIKHWDGVRGRLAGFLAGRIFGLPDQACTREEIERLDGFFTPKTGEVEGSKRPLAEALEGASLCRALHDKASPAVDAFFKVTAKK